MSDRLTTDQWMATDAPLISADGRYAAYLQDDANLVLCYTANGAADLSRPYWSAFANAANLVRGPYTGPHFYAVMQSDGNFVLYNGPSPASPGPPYWATNTNRAKGQFTAIMQTDGNFVVYDASMKPIWASNTWWVSRPITAAGHDRLGSNQSASWIGNDSTLISADGRFAAVLRGDGNLVLCHTFNSMPDFGRTYWSALSSGSVQVRFPPAGPPFYAVMQSDGNFVVYDGTGPGGQHQPYWATNTSRAQGVYTAVIQSDANFVLYQGTPSGNPSNPGVPAIWASGTQIGQYSSMKIVSGNNQSVSCQQYDEFTNPYGETVKLYAAYFQPIQLQFMDTMGYPLAGQQVSWTPSQGNIPSGAFLLLGDAVVDSTNYGEPRGGAPSDANGMCTIPSVTINWLLARQAQQPISFTITATDTSDVTADVFPTVTFNLRTIPGGATVISLRAHANGKIVTADNAGASPLIANRTAIGPWETFVMITNVDGNGNLDGSVSFQAYADDKIVTADNAGASPLIANRTAIGPWEKFDRINNADGSVSFRAHANGKIVTADNAGASPLIANRTAIGPWEEFDLIQD